MSAKGISATRLILAASALGAVGGVALSFKRQHDEALELRALRAQVDALPVEAFPPAPLPEPSARPQAGVPRVDPEVMRNIPPYPNTTPRNLAGAVKGQGLEMKVGMFSTPDPVADVLNYYEKKFGEAGRMVVQHRYSDSAGYVGWLDIRDENLHLVSVIRDGHETMVFPSSTYPGRLLKAAGPVPESLPTLPGTSGSMVFDFDEGQAARRSYFATVDDMSLADVVAFYKKGLAEKGWELTEVNDRLATQVRIDAKRGKGSCNVLVQKKEQKVAIYVSIAGQV